MAMIGVANHHRYVVKDGKARIVGIFRDYQRAVDKFLAIGGVPCAAAYGGDAVAALRALREWAYD
jgi:hypothetical protein